MSTRSRGLGTGLLWVGGTALVGGCAGGTVARGPGGASVYVPPPVRGAATASVTLTIPARGARTAARRPKYVSPGSTALGIRIVPAGFAGAPPPEQIFALPTPGPAPTSTAFAVSAPVGEDTLSATLYDADPRSVPAANALATASVPAVITLNGTNAVSATLLGVARGVVLRANNGSAWRVLQNVSVDQSVSLSAQPVDAQGFAIDGALATAAPLSGTGGVAVSPGSIAGAATVTATYPHGSVAAGSVTSTLPLNNAPDITLNLAVNPYAYLFALDSAGGLTVIDGGLMRQTGPRLTVANVNALAPALAVTGGCPSAAAIVANGPDATIVSVPPASAGNPSPQPAISTSEGLLPGFSGQASTGLVTDPACNAYYASTGPHLYRVARPAAADAARSELGAGVGGEARLWLLGSTLVAADTSGGLHTAAIPGGPIVDLQSRVPAGLTAVIDDGSATYGVVGTCVQSAQLVPFSGGPVQSVAPIGGFEFALGAGAADGTVYLARTVSKDGATFDGYLSYGTVASLVSGSTAPLKLSFFPQGVALSPDRQLLCVFGGSSFDANATGVVDVFRRLPAPALMAHFSFDHTVTAAAFGP